MLCVAFSTLSKHDWLWAVVALVVASVLRSRWPAERSTLGKVFNAVLPPSHLLSPSMRLDAWHWAWVAGWGLGLLALTIVILWRRPLGED